MNPELRNELDNEIRNSPQETQDFLFGDYFRDTIKLIERVNKFTPEQAVALELEVSMFLIGISDYPSLEEALRGELGQDGQVANEATVRQAIKDVENYILSHAPKIDKAGIVRKIEVKPEEIKTNTKTEKEKPLNLHDVLYKELEISKNETTKQNIEPITNSEPSVSLDIEIEVPPENVKEAENETTKPSPLDFYREKIDDEDKKLKHL